MADDRRIIFGSHIVPKEAADSEEAIPQKWTIMRQDSGADPVAKTFGGKGICTDLADNQWGDGWTSMFHSQANWEDQDENWEVSYDYWDGSGLIATDSGTQLAQHAANTTDVVSFCYIKNTGTDNDLSVSLSGSGDYEILIPPGGSFYCRGGDANFKTSKVYIKAVGSPTTAEYIIAKK